jgi:hypothetical protein
MAATVKPIYPCVSKDSEITTYVSPPFPFSVPFLKFLGDTSFAVRDVQWNNLVITLGKSVAREKGELDGSGCFNGLFHHLVDFTTGNPGGWWRQIVLRGVLRVLSGVKGGREHSRGVVELA